MRLSISVVATVALLATAPVYPQGTTKTEPPYSYDDADDAATIYFLSADDVAAGGYVGIYGDDFLGGGTVTLGSTSLTVLTWSPRRVVVQVPTNAVSGPLVVNPNGGIASTAHTLTVHAGRILHLDPTASAGGNGAASAPWRDFSTADTNVLPGDFIVVHGGTFSNSNESVWYAKKAGAANNSITYFAKPGDVVVVDGSTAVKSAIRTDAAFVNFVGFIAQGSQYQNILLNGASSRAVDCEAKNGNGSVSGKGQGINIGGPNAKALGNYVHDNWSHGFYVSIDGLEVGYNYVANSGCCGAPANYGYGVQVFKNPGTTFTGAKVYRNFLIGNNRSGVVVGQYATSSDVYENIIKGNDESGIIVDYGAVNTTIRNNTIVDNDTDGLGYYAIRLLADPGMENGLIATGVTIFNNVIRAGNTIERELAVTGVIQADNDVYDTNSGKWRWNGTTYTSLASWVTNTGNDGHGKVANPGFRAPSTNDYRPAATSPMIDAGDDAHCARPVQGSHCDVGAFESPSGVGSAPSAPTNLRRTERKP